MLCAANSIGRKNHGYQRSGELITAAYKLCFWRAVLSCKKRKTRYTKRVRELAERLGISSETYTNKTHKATRKELHKARKEKKAIQDRDGEARAKWLEEIAQEKANTDPTQDWEKVLEKMKTAAIQKQMHRKITGIFQKSHLPLDYIEIPK